MNRRQLLKLLALGVVGHTLDIDRLLWVPGQKKIFLPATGISYADIVAIELERITPHIRTLFERDDVFYNTFKTGKFLGDKIPLVSSRDMRIPLQLGIDWGKDESYSFGMGRNVEVCKDNRGSSTEVPQVTTNKADDSLRSEED